VVLVVVVGGIVVLVVVVLVVLVVVLGTVLVGAGASATEVGPAVMMATVPAARMPDRA
jgi:hypothetical protein